jgi:hypothetical protein
VAKWHHRRFCPGRELLKHPQMAAAVQQLTKHATHLLNISLKDEIFLKNLPFGIGRVVREILYLDLSETRLSSNDLAASVAQPFQINDATDMKETSSLKRVSTFQRNASDVFLARPFCDHDFSAAIRSSLFYPVGQFVVHSAPIPMF